MTYSYVRPLCIAAIVICIGANAGDAIVGWRGDGSGCYPDATPPLEWSRKSKGIVRSLLTQARKPVGDATDSAKPMRDGVIRQWLAIGAADSAKGLDYEQIPAEDQLQPDEGDKVGEMAWKTVTIVGDKDAANEFNTTTLNWLNLGLALKLEANQLAYAHAYVYAGAAGTVKAIVDHAEGLKVRVNGKPVYDEPRGHVVYWGANNDVYWLKNFIPIPRAVTFQFDLVKGWNRLLFKCVPGKAGCQFDVRFGDPDFTGYETKNIVWTTKLPDFANAMPVIAGDKVFVTSEPDELICLNKTDGKILWKRSYGHYDTLTDDDRKANPMIAEKIDPLAKQLRETEDPDTKMALRKQIRDLLMFIDKEKYELQNVKHLPIVGYCTPTPCCDGKFVYTISGNGVAACFDLDGKPMWIRHAHPQFKGRKGGWDPHGHPGSPVLIDNKFIFHLNYLVALDTKTGREIWRADTDGGNPAPDFINHSLWAATAGGTPVVMTAIGLVYNANSGKQVWDGSSKLRNVNGYTTREGIPCFLLQGGGLGVVKLPDADGAAFTHEIRPPQGGGVNVGSMLISSPLVHEGLVYAVGMNGKLSVTETATGKAVYQKKLDLEPFMFWNGSGVCASLALAGNNIHVMDNRGHMIVFKPGRQFEQLARNTIEDNLPRRIPDDPQELTQSTPAFEGGRIYIRGEENLYCIGEK